jgi:hypothetical protein
MAAFALLPVFVRALLRSEFYTAPSQELLFPMTEAPPKYPQRGPFDPGIPLACLTPLRWSPTL